MAFWKLWGSKPVADQSLISQIAQSMIHWIGFDEKKRFDREIVVNGQEMLKQCYPEDGGWKTK